VIHSEKITDRVISALWPPSVESRGLARESFRLDMTPSHIKNLRNPNGIQF